MKNKFENIFQFGSGCFCNLEVLWLWCDESNYFIGRIQLSNTIILLAYMLGRRSVNDERGQVFISFLFINVVVYLALSLTKTLQSLLWLGVPFFYYERAVKLGYYTKDKPKGSRCLKIAEKLRVKRATFTFWMDTSKLKLPKMVHFWRFFDNLKLAVKECYQTGQF